MVIYKKIYYFIIILHISIYAQAAEQLNALTEYLPPLNYEQDGKVTGFSTELLDLIALDSGITLKKEILPWPRAYSRAQKEANTLIYSMVRTPEREGQFQWLGPISSRRILLYKLAKRKDIVVNKLDDARAYHIGVVRESAAARSLIRQGFDQLDLASDDENNMRKLKHGRFDLLLSLNWAAAYNAEKLGIKNEIVPVQLVAGQTDYWYGISLRTPSAILRKMNRALNTIRKDGRLDRLRQKYISDFQN
ncbi:substrate-binding periplasmic protein [Iodobacter fluviatilis]|uniref:Amino acid ABC transporter substrate-binding protein (PAAT family) n=1 Tax=Iodobacter fluviatilis TaxID=537 RepID=A0A377Q4J1_9NEIS|nr:transporter substrate-binding domain-containing protein [Iodobacter fluviatilis]TCU90482.1 amino acid ABC transporter substrate-binding protein (PAAT family) [Iodobacter fluviatilis]STQ89509.1 Probable amino-acid-binding protein yxeM precursor [Iodobacter fluviatilis]